VSVTLQLEKNREEEKETEGENEGRDRKKEKKREKDFLNEVSNLVELSTKGKGRGLIYHIFKIF
jgi:hypothetical protein